MGKGTENPPLQGEVHCHSHPSPVLLPSVLIVIKDSHREGKCMRFQYIEGMFDLHISVENILMEEKNCSITKL